MKQKQTENSYIEFAQSVLDEKSIPEFRITKSKSMQQIATNGLYVVLSPEKLFKAFMLIFEDMFAKESPRTICKKAKILLDFCMYQECKGIQANLLIKFYSSIKKELNSGEEFESLNKVEKLLVQKFVEAVKAYILKSNVTLSAKEFALLCKEDAKLARLKLDCLELNNNYSDALQHLDLDTPEGFEIACHLVSHFYIKDHDVIADILPKIVKVGNNDNNLFPTADATLNFGVAHLVKLIIKDDVAITQDYYLQKIAPLVETSPNFDIEVALALYSNACLIEGEDLSFTKLLLKHIADALRFNTEPDYAVTVAKRLDYKYSPETDDEIYNLYNNLLLQSYTNTRDIITVVEIVGNNYCVNIKAKHRSELLTLIYRLYQGYGETYEFTAIKVRLNLREDELCNENLWTHDAIAFWSDSKNSLLWEETIIALSKMVDPDQADKPNIKKAIKQISINHQQSDLSFLTVKQKVLIRKINLSI